jgi:serine/threonine protein kinase
VFPPSCTGGGGPLPSECRLPLCVGLQVLNRVPYSYGVDVWSLGVIAYITVCGFPPFPLDMQSDSVKKVKTADFSFPAPYWDDNTPEIKDFIKKAARPAACHAPQLAPSAAYAHPGAACLTAVTLADDRGGP